MPVGTALAEVFHALGDPVRLAMVQRLTENRSCTIAAVSGGLGITRQGARKHLQVLVNAKLATLQPKGRDTVVTLAPDQLEQAKAIIAQLETQWDTRLEALRRFVEE